MEPPLDFDRIPGRIFIDSSTLQVLHTYGAFLYDGAPLHQTARILRMPNGRPNIEALKDIIQVGSRAHFQLALSGNSMREVEGKGDARYLYWAFEILDYWEECFEESDYDYGSPLMARLLHDRQFGYLGEGDRELLKDAVVLGCDAFLTMDEKLYSNSPHLGSRLSLRVLTPVALWRELQPLAALFY
jgi:hypothetical protein